MRAPCQSVKSGADADCSTAHQRCSGQSIRAAGCVNNDSSGWKQQELDCKKRGRWPKILTNQEEAAAAVEGKLIVS